MYSLIYQEGEKKGSMLVYKVCCNKIPDWGAYTTDTFSLQFWRLEVSDQGKISSEPLSLACTWSPSTATYVPSIPLCMS